MVLTRAIDNTPETLHAIVNLPSFTDIVLRPFRNGPGGAIPLGTFLVNTGPPQNPTNPNRPPYPYTACQAEVLLNPASFVSLSISNHERYDLVFGNVSVNGQSPQNVIPSFVSSITPHTGLQFPQGYLNLSPGDQLDYYFEFAPPGTTPPNYYADTGSITIGTGNNDIQTPVLRIGQVLTLFHPSGSRVWATQSVFHSWGFVFTSNDQWALYDYDANPPQLTASGTVQVVTWNDNSPFITINLRPGCTENVTLNAPFDQNYAEFFCKLGNGLTVRFIRQ